MSTHVQVLKDAEDVDHGPLLEFAMWAKEHDDGLQFGQHAYNLPDGEASIIDLGSLHDELKEYFEDPPEVYLRPKVEPPDIRTWLQEQIEKKNVLAYVAW